MNNTSLVLWHHSDYLKNEMKEARATDYRRHRPLRCIQNCLDRLLASLMGAEHLFSVHTISLISRINSTPVWLQWLLSHKFLVPPIRLLSNVLLSHQWAGKCIPRRQNKINLAPFSNSLFKTHCVMNVTRMISLAASFFERNAARIRNCSIEWWPHQIGASRTQPLTIAKLFKSYRSATSKRLLQSVYCIWSTLVDSIAGFECVA